MRACSMASSAVFAFSDAVFDAAHGSERVEGNGMTLHQGVEQLPQHGERLVLGGHRACEPANVFAGQAGSDLA
jgi:hypothetical protein